MKKLEASSDRLRFAVIGGTLLNALAFFAALPYLPLYLGANWEIGPSAIGLIVGSIPLVTAVGGGVSGLLIDRFNAVRMLMIGIALTITGYVLLATIPSLKVTVSLVLALGLGRVLMEPAAKKILSLTDGGMGMAFRWRHASISIGAVAGPLIGGVTFHWSYHAYFIVPALLYFLYFFAVVRLALLSPLGKPFKEPVAFTVSGQRRGRGQVGYVILIGIFVFIVFSQLESVFPLLIRDHLGGAGIFHYTALLVVNAVLNLLWQVVYARMAKEGRSRVSLIAGTISFAASILVFWLGLSLVPFLYVSIVLWSLGQAALLPGQEILLHKISDDNSKGLYFGLAELRYLGFFVGMWFGGSLVSFSLIIYFGFLIAVCLLTIPLIFAATKGKVEDYGRHEMQ